MEESLLCEMVLTLKCALCGLLVSKMNLGNASRTYIFYSFRRLPNMGFPQRPKTVKVEPFPRDVVSQMKPGNGQEKCKFLTSTTNSLVFKFSVLRRRGVNIMPSNARAPLTTSGHHLLPLRALLKVLDGDKRRRRTLEGKIPRTPSLGWH